MALQRWNINLNPVPGISGHDTVGKIKGTTNPDSTPLINLALIRIPYDYSATQQSWDPNNPLMPAALGDAGQSLLTVTPTQYFFLNQWATPPTSPDPWQPAEPGPGELLDMAVLANCLGGRFSPGIDLTFVVRQPDLYIKDWQSGSGPFRIKPQPINYVSVTQDEPVLTQGYVPLHTGNKGCQPGDLSKWMALPWHTDYNSCATHTPSPNPRGNVNLFWSWPAQRPVAVYVAKEIKANKDHGGLMKNGLPLQRWSVRGEGTGDMSTPAEKWGRYQKGEVHQMLTNWSKIGLIMNATAIDTPEDGAPMPPDFGKYYLEVQSQLETNSSNPPVVPFPNKVGQMPGDV